MSWQDSMQDAYYDGLDLDEDDSDTAAALAQAGYGVTVEDES